MTLFLERQPNGKKLYKPWANKLLALRLFLRLLSSYCVLIFFITSVVQIRFIYFLTSPFCAKVYCLPTVVPTDKSDGLKARSTFNNYDFVSNLNNLQEWFLLSLIKRHVNEDEIIDNLKYCTKCQRMSVYSRTLFLCIMHRLRSS